MSIQPITGSGEACLDHFLKHVSTDSTEWRGLQEFLGVSLVTLDRWKRKGRRPVGEILLRTLVFLEKCGYHVAELERLPKPIRDSAILVAHQVLTLVEVTELVGYTGDTKNASSNLLQVYWGARGLLPERLKRFVELANSYEAELKAAEEKVVAVTPVAPASPQAAVLPPCRPAQREPLRLKSEKPLPLDMAAMRAFAQQAQGLLVLARYFNSDSCTPQERAELRALIGEKQLFELANTLYGLSGERSRNSREKV